jgi:hypothetical protein
LAKKLGSRNTFEVKKWGDSLAAEWNMKPKWICRLNFSKIWLWIDLNFRSWFWIDLNFRSWLWIDLNEALER